MHILSRLFGPPVPGVDALAAAAKLAASAKIVAEARPYVLDVRQPEEYAAGHIAGARLIPLGELQGRADELPRDREIVVVCASGSRSASATRLLASLGYNAVNLNGGMGAWAAAGQKIVKGA
jgi:rhodanese-related sulfurtransferase